MAKTIVPQDRTVYESPDGRIKVVRHASRDFSLFCDGQYTKSYEFQYQAEHDGAVWLEEQADELTAILADEAAERDAEHDGELVITQKDDDWTEYALGVHTLNIEGVGAERGVSLWRGGHELIDFTSDVRYPGELTGPESFAALRALAHFLDHPVIRRIIGLDTPPPPPLPAPLPKNYAINLGPGLKSGGGIFMVPLTFRRIEGQLYINIGEEWEYDDCDGPQAVRSITRMERRNILMVDTDQEAFLVTEAEFLAHGGDWESLAPRATAVRVERWRSEEDGENTSTGTRFLCGVEGKGGAEVFIPDEPCDYDVPVLYAFQREGLRLEDVEATLPSMLALLSDPRVQQARVRLAAGAPVLPVKAAA
jgi:hypothetical protein